MRKECHILDKPIVPDQWTLRYLFQNYHEERRGLKAENRKGHIDFATMYNQQEKLEDKYIQMTRLAFTKDILSFGTLMTIETFIKYQKSKSFISYDGSGDYLDWDGNELGSINWSDYNKYPEGTVFVAWYNK
jgi:hypothetical protein